MGLALLACANPAATLSPSARPPVNGCHPGQPCWPSPEDWKALGTRVGGRLVPVVSPLEACVRDGASPACNTAIANAKNPFFLQDQPGGTESMGWLGAWNAATSAYAVAAESPADVIAAVEFARHHGVRLVVKGTGHDYLGRSNAPDSLLVWMHAMRTVTLDDAFVPKGCLRDTRGVPAVTVQAGTRWLEVYQEVTVRHHRYVQGGGCTSVGAAGGFLQGGGFGSWSKKYGIAAGSMLEAEVVTADGQLRVANACQNQDLFWALRGGGGGTFGIVTHVTLMTHAPPSDFGFVNGSIKAKSDAAFAELLEHFVAFYGQSLATEHWGEQVRVKGDNRLEISLAFESLTEDESRRLWEPFRTWLESLRGDFTVDLRSVTVPPEIMWDRADLEKHPGIIEVDQRPGSPGLFWWEGDGGQVAAYWYSYQSRWIPQALWRPASAATLARALFEASRHWTVELHFNKGQAGAAPDAVQRDRETSMNPAVLDAAALAIVAASGHGFPGVAGHEPDAAAAQSERDHARAAMKVLADATPGAGSYVNETDYFEPDWQHAFWGMNYERLLAIKRKYDPDGFFVCHHCVGSEASEAR
jgi:FAD/FMN-containing dehydrogenase